MRRTNKNNKIKKAKRQRRMSKRGGTQPVPISEPEPIPIPDNVPIPIPDNEPIPEPGPIPEPVTSPVLDPVLDPEEEIDYKPREALYKRPTDLVLTLEEMKQSFEEVQRNGFEIKTDQINTLLTLIKEKPALTNDEKKALKDIRATIDRKWRQTAQTPTKPPPNEFSILGLLFPFLSSTQPEETDHAYLLIMEILQKVKDFSLTQSDLRLLSQIYCKNNERGFRQNEYKIFGTRVYSTASIVQQKINKIVKLLTKPDRLSYNSTLCRGGKKTQKNKSKKTKKRRKSSSSSRSSRASR